MTLTERRSPLLTAMIDLLVTSPSITELLHEHREVDQHCAVCRGGGDGSLKARYPCTIRRGAETAWIQQQQGVRGI